MTQRLIGQQNCNEEKSTQIIEALFLMQISKEVQHGIKFCLNDPSRMVYCSTISEYQGRIYVDDIFDAFDEDGYFKDETLWEFVSEPFREYIENPENLKKKSRELYDLVREAVE